MGICDKNAPWIGLEESVSGRRGSDVHSGGGSVGAGSGVDSKVRFG